MFLLFSCSSFLPLTVKKKYCKEKKKERGERKKGDGGKERELVQCWILGKYMPFLVEFLATVGFKS